MTLQEINKDKIIFRYNNIYVFNVKMQRCITYIPNAKDKTMLRSILLYYNNLFSTEVYFEEDVITYLDLAYHNAERLLELHKEYGYNILLFLAEMIYSNIHHCSHVRKLA